MATAAFLKIALYLIHFNTKALEVTVVVTQCYINKIELKRILRYLRE